MLNPPTNAKLYNILHKSLQWHIKFKFFSRYLVQFFLNLYNFLSVTSLKFVFRLENHFP